MLTCAVRRTSQVISRIHAGAASFKGAPPALRRNLHRSERRFRLPHSNLLLYKMNREIVSVQIINNVCNTTTFLLQIFVNITRQRNQQLQARCIEADSWLSSIFCTETEQDYNLELVTNVIIYIIYNWSTIFITFSHPHKKLQCLSLRPFRLRYICISITTNVEKILS